MTLVRLSPAASDQREMLRSTGANFDAALARAGIFPLHAKSVEVLQVNVGKVCNQACAHCHVDAGPHRREAMTRETAETCIAALERTGIRVLDITGGAPELNANFRYLVSQARRLGCHVMDRCNLTVLLLPSQSGTIEFLAEHEVEIVASLPCYLEQNVDGQRGDGVFAKSIEALRRLNAAGFGQPESRLRLNLMYNPTGPTLPPPQEKLEADYKRALQEGYGVVFHALYTLANMPISRWLESLHATGRLDAYMRRLEHAFNPEAARRVMCRTTVSVGWDGILYDCDFNQMLDMSVNSGIPCNIRDFDIDRLEARLIRTGEHCFGCTAGAGSSCNGSLAGA